MKIEWQIDYETTVTASFGFFGKEVVSVNGKSVIDRRRFNRRGSFDFQIGDGRIGTIMFNPQRIFGETVIELSEGDRSYTPTPKKPLLCSACKAALKPYDLFCERCGAKVPTESKRVQRAKLEGATGAIRILAVLFALSGVVMFFFSKSQANAALANLDKFSDTETVITSDGTQYVAGDLRRQVELEPWMVLISNLVLSGIMIGLALWSKRSPLAAVLVALAIYVVVIAGNAAIDPNTIAQGIIVKIFILGLFAKGIQAAVSARSADV